MAGNQGTRLLTGATDGIGLALARRWRSRGIDAFLHGRRALDQLDPQVFDHNSYVRADLARPEEPERVVRFLNERGVEEIELLVLNAGVGWFGPLPQQSEERIREVIEVDLLAPMRLCHLLLPRLERAGGRVVFVSSVAAALPCPMFAVYAAAKAAAEGFFRSLRVELAGSVEVQVIRPGAVRTGMHAKSGLEPPEGALKRFPSAEAIAERIDRMIAGPPVWRTLGFGNRAMGAVGRNLPRLVERIQARRAP